MCDKAVDDFLLELKFVFHWSVTSRKILKLLNSLFGDDDILCFDEDSSFNFTFSSNRINFLDRNVKTQKMCDEDISNYPFVLKYCLDRQKTKKCVIKPLMIF